MEGRAVNRKISEIGENPTLAFPYQVTGEMRLSPVCWRLEELKDFTDWSLWGPLVQRVSTGVCTDCTALHTSVLPTRHLQRSLFRLPVPKLEKTCARYLEAVKPLVPPKQYDFTAKVVQEFEANEGIVLQDELVRTNKANRHTSYVSADWCDRYLMDRTPLPINRNPCLVTRRDADKQDMLTRATFWISSSVIFQQKYLDNTLQPDIYYSAPPNHYCRSDWFQRTVALSPEYVSAKVMSVGSNFHAFPLDMSRYDYLMCSTRVPGVLRDEIKAVGFAQHIIVLYRGQQYVVTVADKDCRPLPDEQIYARLKAIADLNAAPPDIDVGIFTSMDRTSWHAVRLSMARHQVNQQNLELLDSALFVVCLDDDVVVDYLKPGGATGATRSMLAKETNRWFDKSISIIVTKDGALGVSFEHSWGDGLVVKRYVEDVFNHSIMRSSKDMPRDVSPTEPVRQLKWCLPPELQHQALKAKTRMSGDMRRLDFCTSLLPGTGFNDPLLRNLHIGLDGLMQVAMQLAWWRLNKSTVSTYESCSTAAYLRGRTDCIRPATIESQAFTMLMDSPGVPISEKRDAFLCAVKKHRTNVKNTRTGQGVDCHLFALSKVAERRNPQRVPLLFSDPSYATLTSNILSTSSLFSNAVVGGGFGPVSAGYGVGYAAGPECLLFNVSCWKECGPIHSAEEFSRAICTAVVDCYNMIED